MRRPQGVLRDSYIYLSAACGITSKNVMRFYDTPGDAKLTHQYLAVRLRRRRPQHRCLRLSPVQHRHHHRHRHRHQHYLASNPEKQGSESHHLIWRKLATTSTPNYRRVVPNMLTSSGPTKFAFSDGSYPSGLLLVLRYRFGSYKAMDQHSRWSRKMKVSYPASLTKVANQALCERTLLVRLAIHNAVCVLHTSLFSFDT